MTKASEESMDMQAGETQESVQASMGEFRVAMLHKAETLAEEEMARLAAIELLYKNISEMQMEIIPAELRRVGGWVKSYRKYTGYEINDIYRSDSYLNPIVFEIAYQFDQFHTEVRTWENMKSQGLSMKDKKFKMIKKDALIRRYRCDENGDYLGNLPEMPPRPSIFIETYFNQDRVAEEFEGIANPLPAK
jgi:hypothetical protein